MEKGSRVRRRMIGISQFSIISWKKVTYLPGSLSIHFGETIN